MYRCGQRCRVSGRHQETIDPVGNDITAPRNIRGNERFPASGSL